MKNIKLFVIICFVILCFQINVAVTLSGIFAVFL